MKLRDILEKTLEIVGDADIDLSTAGEKRSKLISCANMIYAELTEEYVHLKHAETLTVSDGRIYYSEFSKQVKDVMRVRRNGLTVPFNLYPLYLSCDVDGEVEVSYVYHPTEANIDDELDLPPQFTAFALANGVASEYFYRSGLTDEALFYKNRYDTTLLNLTRKRNPFSVKYRRFI